MQANMVAELGRPRRAIDMSAVRLTRSGRLRGRRGLGQTNHQQVSQQCLKKLLQEATEEAEGIERRVPLDLCPQPPRET
jgi:hypothetical protein